MMPLGSSACLGMAGGLFGRVLAYIVPGAGLAPRRVRLHRHDVGNTQVFKKLPVLPVPRLCESSICLLPLVALACSSRAFVVEALILCERASDRSPAHAITSKFTATQTLATRAFDRRYTAREALQRDAKDATTARELDA